MSLYVYVFNFNFLYLLDWVYFVFDWVYFEYHWVDTWYLGMGFQRLDLIVMSFFSVCLNLIHCIYFVDKLIVVGRFVHMWLTVDFWYTSVYLSVVYKVLLFRLLRW